MSFLIVNGYKIVVDGGIFVDGKRVDDKFTYQQVFEACRTSPRKAPDYLVEAEAEERAERSPQNHVDKGKST